MTGSGVAAGVTTEAGRTTFGVLAATGPEATFETTGVANGVVYAACSRFSGTWIPALL